MKRLVAGFLTFGIIRRVYHKFVRGNGLNVAMVEPTAKFIQKQPVILDRIFSPSFESENQ